MTEVVCLGGLVFPFERLNKKLMENQFEPRSIDVGEDRPYEYVSNFSMNKEEFFQKIEPYYIDSLAEGFEPFELGRTNKEQKFLWVIDLQGFKMILEKTVNLESARGCVCHTNITGGEKAIQGGEIWIDTLKVAYINNKSGRYDTVSEEEFNSSIEYIKSLDLFTDVSKAYKKYRV